MDLQGKVSLITGGTSGIGAATALRLARRGSHVASISRKGASGITDDRLLSAIATHGVTIRFMEADVGDPSACRGCANEVAREFGRLDVVVHSAGKPFLGDLFAVTDDDWMEAFSIHVHSVFHLTRAAIPYIKQQQGGAIILIGSAGGLRGCLGSLAYGVAKGALPQFARNLARELADDGIRVNCVSPGIIRTPFQDFLTPEQTANNIQNRIPLHREGTPDDVAELIVSLIENDFITGENFVIDGGMTMRMV